MLRRILYLSQRLPHICRFYASTSHFTCIRLRSDFKGHNSTDDSSLSAKNSAPSEASHSDNPGPPVTYDYIPIPHQKYHSVYARLQKKFNMYLAFSLLLFTGSMYLAYKEDLFAIEAIRAPESYRFRNRKMKSSESKAAPPSSEDSQTSVEKVASPASPGEQTVPEQSKEATKSSEHIYAKQVPMAVVVDKLKETIEPDDKVRPLESSSAVDHNITVSDVVPEHIPYLIIGSGTAAYYASLAIRARDADAKVLMVGEESELPYSRPPLSKELWWYGDEKATETLEYKNLSGKIKDVYYEAKGFYVPPSEITEAAHGGVSLLPGHRITKLDTSGHVAYFDDGREIRYGKCLIATGGKPRNHPLVEKAGTEVNRHVTLYRTIDDFRYLDQKAKTSKSIVIIGGGLLGSELAYSLNRRHSSHGLKVTQVFREKGNVAQVLPEFLSVFTSKELEKCGINIIPESDLTDISVGSDGRLILTLNSAETVYADHVVISLGIEPSTELAIPSQLEVDKENGGFTVDAELRARSDVWVAGDASSFYDVKLGRRRVEHWEHAQVTGRLAGENMTGAGKSYWHQSSFYSLIAPNVHFQAVGKVDSSLPTVSVFASGKNKEELTKGVVFYMNHDIIVGVVLFNVFGDGIDVARRLISDGRKQKDMKEVAKLFDLYEVAEENEKSNAKEEKLT
ncbi:hypothetical protein AB6A40_004910 [Gnathostoma spinigerum]|uniref:Uncharacterized protein n=1 Tax=Gnathostoma spinigerum TaxID=75299 RepID=A0ABD6EEW8_9BILA